MVQSQYFQKPESMYIQEQMERQMQQLRHILTEIWHQQVLIVTIIMSMKKVMAADIVETMKKRLVMNIVEVTMKRLGADIAEAAKMSQAAEAVEVMKASQTVEAVVAAAAEAVAHLHHHLKDQMWERR